MSYTQLDRGHLIATVARLQDRIRERFPAAGLLAVAGDLRAVVERHAARSEGIRRPVWRLRLASAALLALGLALAAWLVFAAGGAAPAAGPTSWRDSVQTAEATISALFLLGAAAIFVASLELRHKRRRCLEALHELRALAHIVDLHQLTKDPDLALSPEHPDVAANERPLTPFLLARYLDYCSEMLSLIGKVGALYAQEFPDPQAVDAVDDIEDLTTGLSRKVWQKIMILTNPGTGSAGA